MALRTLRVLEISGGIAGPVAGMLLADHGADVIKVEAGAGDPARSTAGFCVWNRNKRGILLDVSSHQDRLRLEELLAGADVCIDSSTPADVEGSLLDHDRLVSRYPALVVVSTPPTPGRSTPWWGGQEANGLLEALSGAAVKQVSYEGGPIDSVLPALLYMQGAWAATCTVASLLERRRSGKGQVVSVTGMHGALVTSMLGYTFREGVSTAAQPGAPRGRSPFYRIYQCGDGEWLVMAALTDKFHRRAFEVLGLQALLDDPRIYNKPGVVLTQEADRRWLIDIFEAAFRAKPLKEWLRILGLAGIPAAQIRTNDGWLDDEIIRQAGLRAELDDPQHGRVTMPGLFVDLHDSPGLICGPAPQFGQHSESLAWHPQSVVPRGDAPETVSHAGGPLSNYRVANSGTMVAGPMTGSLLAELGADVVKVESLEGDPFRVMGYPYNRGMRSLSVDFGSPEGREVLAKLAASCDVFISSNRPLTAAKLCLDYESVRRWNKEVVYYGITAFGEVGPYRNVPGFDPVLQALSGMMRGQGGPEEPVMLTSALNDVATAALGAFGVAVALWHRESTRTGQWLGVSLAQASTFMQSGELVSYPGRPPRLSGARDRRGSGPADQYYKVADGWVRVAPRGARRPTGGIVEQMLQGDVAHHVAEIDADLALRLRDTPSAEVLQFLWREGIPAVKARSANEIVGDQDLMAEGVLHLHHADRGGAEVYMAGRLARFSRTEESRSLAPPGLGEHSVDVLKELGASEEQIAALVASGIVRAGEAFHFDDVVQYR